MQLQSNELVTIFDNVTNLVEKEIPQQGVNLADNVTNLEKVAQYCEDIYVNSRDQNKTHLLNETKGFTTQALASVAYQIHVLSNSFLGLLENQSSLVEDMGNSMSNLAHEVNIHKEKVARREIGVLTTNKCVVRTAKVKRPDVDEKPVKYVRKPIDYSIMDDIGHGVKLSRQSSNLDPLGKISVGRQNSYSSTHSSSGIQNGAGSGLINNTPGDMSTPPLHLKSSTILNVNSGNGSATVRSTASSYYRTPVAPPSVPSEYLSRQELGIYSSKKELNQSAGADTLSSAYGGPMGYKQRPSINNSSLNMPNNPPINTSVNEYSGTDTIDRRMAQTYMQQFNMPPGLNNSLNLNANNSVSYASGKDMNIIRTNLNNIDYTTTGTIYRRPQLHPSVYERSNVGSTQHQDSNNLNSSRNSNGHQLPQSQRGSSSNNQNNTSVLSNRSNGSNGLQGLPPPPQLMFNPDMQFTQQQNFNGVGADNLENEMFGEDYIDRVLNLEADDDDDGVVPNWVPIDRCIEKVITTYDYEGVRDDELSFKENMYIYVIKKNDDHWYEGIMKNELGNIVQGLYPYNYARCVRKFSEDSRVTQC